MEQIAQLIEILKQTPEMALWGISIFLFWKLATMASWVGAIAFTTKLFINRYFDWKKIEAENKKIELSNKRSELKRNEILRLFKNHELNSTVRDLQEFFNEVGRQYPDFKSLRDAKRLLKKGKEAERNERGVK